MYFAIPDDRRIKKHLECQQAGSWCHPLIVLYVTLNQIISRNVNPGLYITPIGASQYFLKNQAASLTHKHRITQVWKA